jgi:ribonuclease J
MNIELFGGVNEIGGNKILVEHDKTRVFLDFGTSMGYESDFFSDFLDARTNTSLKDRISIRALPKINGIYRRDLVIPDNMNSVTSSQYHRILREDSEFFGLDEVLTFEEYRRKNGKGFVDGIVLSHAHLDHTGAISFLHSSIPLFCSKVTDTLVRAIDDVTLFKSEAIVSKSCYVDFNGEKSAFPFSPKIKHNPITRKSNSLSDLQTFTLGSFSVTHISQDHSVPGASSYVVEGDGKKILYTGDIRFHGTMTMTIDDYVKKVGSGIDVMICEGTRIDSEKTLSEHDIVKNISSRIKSVKGLVFVDFSWKDTTRYETVLKACKESGRIFVINARLAYILDKLGQYPDDRNVLVYLKRKDSCLYSPSDYTKSKYEYGLSVDWEGGIDSTHYDNAITACDIKKNPGKYVMMLSYFDLNQIFDLADAKGQIPDSWLIKAQCAPFCDEMELDEERFIHWLKTFGIGFELDSTPLPDDCSNPTCSKIKKRMKRDHVSGHISRSEIRELIEKVNPRTVIPVHTENSKEFVKIVDDIEKGVEVILPEYGKRYEF